MAHVDCDAFYATVEKRDNPAIADKPVIIGGGKRGVVSAACYVARTFGVKSAMPMYKALEACPKAVVIPPNIPKYAIVSRDVKQLMLETTPLVEPLSLDEAFLDLTGTERLHKRTPAQTLAHLAKRIEDELQITVSVGLSFNKFLAKVASDLDKPRGFSVIGRAEAVDFLDKRPVTLLPGVGKAFAQSLARDGIFTIGDVRRRKPKTRAPSNRALKRRASPPKPPSNTTSPMPSNSPTSSGRCAIRSPPAPRPQKQAAKSSS
jgi:DNA polymerase-4